MDRRYANGLETRARILDAAVVVFGEHGYHGSSLRAIASVAGITHPGLLYQFPNKAALLIALLEDRDIANSKVIAQAIDSGDSHFDGMVNLLRSNAEQAELVELFMIMASEATRLDHPGHDYFKQRYAGVLKRMENQLLDSADDGRLAPGVDPAVMARVLVAVMDGLQIQWLMSRQPDSDSPEIDMAAHFSALMSVLLPAWKSESATDDSQSTVG